LITRINN